MTRALRFVYYIRSLRDSLLERRREGFIKSIMLRKLAISLASSVVEHVIALVSIKVTLDSIDIGLYSL